MADVGCRKRLRDDAPPALPKAVPLTLQALAVWGLLITGLVWVWGAGIDPWQWYWKALVAASGLIVFEVLLGVLWRASVSLRRQALSFQPGAALVPALLGAVALVALVDEWRDPGPTRAFWVLLFAAVLLPLGFVWRAAVDPEWRDWLWPTALVGLPVVVIPGVVIVFSTLLALVVDFARQPRLPRETRNAPLRRRACGPTAGISSQTSGTSSSDGLPGLGRTTPVLNQTRMRPRSRLTTS